MSLILLPIHLNLLISQVEFELVTQDYLIISRINQLELMQMMLQLTRVPFTFQHQLLQRVKLL